MPKLFLTGCEGYKEFTVFDFKMKVPEGDEDQPMDGEENKKTISYLQQSDLVIVSPYDLECNSLANECFFIGIVDSLKEDVAIIKTVLDKKRSVTMKDEAQRFNNLVKRAQDSSEWQVKRLISLNSYNRQYLALNGVSDLGGLQEFFLDPCSSSEKKITGAGIYPEFNQKCKPLKLARSGIMAIEGTFMSGKTTLIPRIVHQYKHEAMLNEEKEKMKKDKLKNLKVYSVQEILDGDSSSDDEMYDDSAQNGAGMAHFPWFKPGYTNIYDDLEMDTNAASGKNMIYPKADVTDKKVYLHPSGSMSAANLHFGGLQEEQEVEVKPPNRFLIITASQGAADAIIHCFERHQEAMSDGDGSSPSKVQGLVRIASSQHDKKINQKYSLDMLADIPERRDKKAMN